MARPNQYGWKNLNAPAGAGGAPPPADAPVRRRWRRQAAAGVGVGALTALVVLVVLMWGRSSYPVVVIIAPQGTGLAYPENAPGRAAAGAFADWLKEGGRNRPTLADEVVGTPADRGGWAKALKPGLFDPTGGTVCYVAAPAASDARGPFVWLPPADPKTPHAPLAAGDKLHVTDIVKELARRSGPKLLVFDLAPGPLPWAADGVSPGFTAALKDMAGEIAAVPELAVIVSADDGERAWASAGYRGTVFGHHFAHGARGAGQAANADVTGKTLFDHVGTEVGGWAARFRNAAQHPVLLPAGDDGAKRAAAVTLGRVPPGGYTAPTPPAPQADRAAVQAEWTAAERLEKRSPERTDPEGWKRYLAWLLRWEQRVRDGADVGTAADDTRTLGQRLADRLDSPDVTYPLVSVAVPDPAAADKPDIDKLWKAKDDTEAGDELGRVAGRPARPGVRRAAAQLVLDRLADGPGTAAEWAQAGRVLGAIDGTEPDRPAETHLVRLLARELDPKRRAVPLTPTAATWKSAVTTRQLAEQAAWGGDGESRPEQVFRWTRSLFAAADADRLAAEDLVFAGGPAAEADALLAKATAAYETARRRAAAVGRALDTRDLVFARLPFYARWVADGDRTLVGRSRDALDRLVRQVELAARHAHKLDDLLTTPANTPDPVAGLTADTDAARTAFDAVRQAHDDELAGLLNSPGSVLTANWHALDAAAAVPFGPAGRRKELLDRLDTMTRTLDEKGQTLPAAGGKAADGREAAAAAHRHVRMAVAVLNLADLTPPAPTEGAANFRDLSDRVGDFLRGVPAKAADQTKKWADADDPLAAAEPPLAEAARLTRLADPAALVNAAVDPVAADRRYWRHQFLLWQAGRAVRDGYADLDTPTTTTVPGQPTTVVTADWYCRKVADALTKRAGDLAIGLLANPTAAQTAKLRAAAADAAKKEPAVVLPTADQKVVVVKDYKRWGFGFRVAPRPGEVAGGFPAVWVESPDRYRAAAGGKVEPVAREPFRGGPAGGPAADRRYHTPDGAAAVSERLDSHVLYRGHLAVATTAVAFTGDPLIEYVHTPPKPTDPAGLALIADDRLGAVTVLIDRSTSMWFETWPTETNRYQDAFVGLRALLKALPEGTFVTLVGFDHVDQKTRLVRFGKPSKLDRVKFPDPTEQFGVTVATLKPVEKAFTPLADSIRQVLADANRDTYWPPKAAFTGARSVVVLTDGQDTINPADAGGLVGKALLGCDDVVNLHLVFFKMSKGEEDAAYRQFGDLQAGEAGGKNLAGHGKLPVSLSKGVKDGPEFANKVIEQFNPRVTYQPLGRSDPRATGELVAGMRHTEGWAWSPKQVPAGDYRLAGGVAPREVTLHPGDRLVLKAGRPALTAPPVAYEYALTRDEVRKGQSGGGVVSLTVPRVEVRGGDARLTVTLERGRPAKADRLWLHRPLVPWFDLTDPARADAPPRMRVTNDPELVAPAWAVDLPGWDRTSDQTKPVRMPELTGYWIDQAVLAAAKPALLPESGAGVKPSALVEEAVVNVGDLQVRRENRPGGPVVIAEADYQGRGMAYLRMVWPDPPPPERHAYYHDQGRYTVTYGPLSVDQLEQPLRFERYDTADLRRAAGPAGAVKVTLPTLSPARTGHDRTTNLKFGAGR